jgi:hypothetical protein
MATTSLELLLATVSGLIGGRHAESVPEDVSMHELRIDAVAASRPRG